MRISVIVPTRERSYTLRHCLAASLATDDPELELIVSDNCSMDDTQTVVAEIDDPRLIYARTPARVSMRQNFEFGLSHATGDYIIFIGDDDAFLASQLPLLRHILETRRPEALNWEAPYYMWPDDSDPKLNNRLSLRKDQFTGTITHIETATLVDQALNARTGPHTGPAIYHGCMSRDLLERVQTRYGTVFGGRIPDVYLQYASLFVAQSYDTIAHPFTINGTSKASNGYAVHPSAQKRKKSENDQFSQENQTDPRQDVLPGRMPEVSLYFLSTLATVLRDLGDHRQSISYPQWFRFCLKNLSHHDESIRVEGQQILREFAVTSGLEEDYDAALHEASATAAPAIKVVKQAKPVSQRRFFRSYIKPKRIVIDVSAVKKRTVAGAADVIKCLVSKPEDVLTSNTKKRWRAMQWRTVGLLIKSFLPRASDKAR